MGMASVGYDLFVIREDEATKMVWSLFKGLLSKKEKNPTLLDSIEANACVITDESSEGATMPMTRHFALCGYWGKHVLMTGGEADMRATEKCLRLSPNR